MTLKTKVFDLFLTGMKIFFRVISLHFETCFGVIANEPTVHSGGVSRGRVGLLLLAFLTVKYYSLI